MKNLKLFINKKFMTRRAKIIIMSIFLIYNFIIINSCSTLKDNMLLDAYVNWPMNGSFAAPEAIPVTDQSILAPHGRGNGAYIAAINGKPFGGYTPFGRIEQFVLWPGNYDISIGYLNESDNSAQLFFHGTTTPSHVTRRVFSINDYNVNINFEPGRLYYLIGGVVGQNRLAYAIIDFTTDNHFVVWSTDSAYANEVLRTRAGIINNRRVAIDYIIRSNAGLYQ